MGLDDLDARLSVTLHVADVAPCDDAQEDGRSPDPLRSGAHTGLGRPGVSAPPAGPRTWRASAGVGPGEGRTPTTVGVASAETPRKSGAEGVGWTG